MHFLKTVSAQEKLEIRCKLFSPTTYSRVMSSAQGKCDVRLEFALVLHSKLSKTKVLLVFMTIRACFKF